MGIKIRDEGKVPWINIDALLVVFAIIALFLTVLMPTLTRTRHQNIQKSGKLRPF